MKREMYKRDSEIEQRLQKIEALMEELHISITSFAGNGLNVSYKDKAEGFLEGESGLSWSLPRMTEDERIVWRKR